MIETEKSHFFARSIGQNRAIEILISAVQQNRVAPAYLFFGANGIGKRLVAECFSNLLLSQNLPEAEYPSIRSKVKAKNHPDLFWIQPTYLDRGKMLTVTEAAAAGIQRKAPPQIRIEQIREISQFLSRPPLESSLAVVTIENAHTMTEAAANALLKTLEEPGKATLILIAPAIDSLLPTLVSRCQRIPFSRLSPENTKRILIEAGYDAISAYPELIDIAQGSPGDTIESLTQLQAIPEQILTSLQQPPDRPLQALQIAKTIDKELDSQVQLWLLDYLQYYYWRKWQQIQIVEQLEKARRCLLSYVQPRLVWECTLLNIYSKFDRIF